LDQLAEGVRLAISRLFDENTILLRFGSPGLSGQLNLSV
jgi:hypothetical protein